jgi:hypothetical protein
MNGTDTRCGHGGKEKDTCHSRELNAEGRFSDSAIPVNDVWFYASKKEHEFA